MSDYIFSIGVFLKGQPRYKVTYNPSKKVYWTDNIWSSGNVNLQPDGTIHTDYTLIVEVDDKLVQLVPDGRELSYEGS